MRALIALTSYFQFVLKNRHGFLLTLFDQCQGRFCFLPRRLRVAGMALTFAAQLGGAEACLALAAGL